ncbi:MAG: Phosphate transport system permease protein PstA [uncultured Chthoniobacterales bacterium]|uniref:Phosphate transport system permease protein PstA n=1 Tax=uncultured Chthoniobacterales bacterium TaxID=1836801 RepID=A0A6J4HW23_9BACT|nr:MAG: Phosphate transport system permease protein PstA [uncultured Chthoniobacterales bacterium]
MTSVRPHLRRSRIIERIAFWAFRIATYIVLAFATYIFLDIGIKGARTVFTTTAPFVNTTFLFDRPQTLYVFEHEGQKMTLGDTDFRAWKETHGEPAVDPTTVAYSAGGIWPCIVGTALLVVGSMVLALFVGISSAIYLSEYSRNGRFIKLVRIAILNLAGVPSIVFGLFGFGLFVIFFGWNVSLLAGWFTLGLMILPAIITASEESLRAVPQGLREGSLALGATKWQTIRKNVLPYALPGILTSSILGIARVAGETAPIMFTAAYAMRDEMPWQVSRASDFVFQGVMALPYHIYVVSSKIPQNEYTERVQYGAAFVFLALVMLIALTSIVLREKSRSRLSW